MKTTQLILFLLIILFFTSCSTTFFQVYDVKSKGDLTYDSDSLIFEDENCKIIYNMWSNGGNIGFVFFNKTDQFITIKLDESFFVLNGFAYDYYLSREKTDTNFNSFSRSERYNFSVAEMFVNLGGNTQINKDNNSSMSSLKMTAGSSTSFKEKSEITIPPKTNKIIDEYKISNKLIRDCELERFPTKRNINTLSYDSENSPVQFSNLITYEIDGVKVEVANEFYVSDVTNYPVSLFYDKKQEEICGKKTNRFFNDLKEYAPDKFYLEYEKKGSKSKY